MRAFIVLMLAAAAMSTAACNTVAGAGRDVTSVGRKVTQTAK